ncbi:hypothetical protein KUV50_04875 [Membranicola marinus]|uniref:Uncharacterized protein n=1 Tax=Membranihabitans marinus TaxID=1227546 RepID=A0A953HMW2_9BACT|nr:hypothetical protein [Membranihabitans marinus]MBY5957458.1 hypothetical protein [Membranihabitans marinus]
MQLSKKLSEVKCDGSTLYWDDGLEFEDYDGQIKDGPLDMAPEVLFKFTKKGKTNKICPAKTTKS